MSLSDPIADMLTRIRNATRARRKRVDVPASRMNAALAELLVREKFIAEVKLVEERSHRVLRLQLKYSPAEASVITGIRRVSRPGLRVYAGAGEIPRVQGGLGTAVLSTPKGILTDKECRRARVGGEIICYVW